MTHGEFVSLITYQKRYISRLSITLLSLLIIFILREVFEDRLRSIAPWFNSFLCAILLLLLFFVASVIIWKGYKFENEFRCPHCLARVCDYPLAPAVIATGRCGSCGKQIFNVTSGEHGGSADLGPPQDQQS